MLGEPRKLTGIDLEFWRANNQVVRQAITQLKVLIHPAFQTEKQRLSAVDQVWVAELAHMADRLLYQCSQLAGLPPGNKVLYAESDAMAKTLFDIVDALVEHSVVYGISVFSDIREFPVVRHYDEDYRLEE